MLKSPMGSLTRPNVDVRYKLIRRLKVSPAQLFGHLSLCHAAAGNHVSPTPTQRGKLDDWTPHNRFCDVNYMRHRHTPHPDRCTTLPAWVRTRPWFLY